MPLSPGSQRSTSTSIRSSPTTSRTAQRPWPRLATCWGTAFTARPRSVSRSPSSPTSPTTWPPASSAGRPTGVSIEERSTASTISWRPAERRSYSPPLSTGRHRTSTRTCSSPLKPSADSPTSRSPRAEHVHRTNADVPEELIEGLAELGIFGLSAPVEYGGFAEGGINDYLGMVVATEELSRGSLGIGGSLITRPEILTRALIAGGTEDKTALATSACLGRGHGRRRGHRAGLRIRRRRHSGGRHPDRWRVGHQRCQDMVHLRRPGRRLDGARPHRVGHHRPQGPVGLHRREAEGRWPRLRAPPERRRQDDRASDRHARLPRYAQL